jgi:hypothetical protein
VGLNAQSIININFQNRPYNPYAPNCYQSYSGSVLKPIKDVIKSFQSPDAAMKQKCLDLLDENLGAPLRNGK